MKCVNGELCDLAKMVKIVAKDSNVSEDVVIDAVKKLLENYEEECNRT